MKIELTHEESETYFHNALCNGLNYIAGYGLEIEYTGAELKQAQTNYASAHPNELACYEDILMQILRDGNTLKLTDNEDEDEDNVKEIKLSDVHERVAQTPIEHLMDMINENDDADTADVIIQTVFLGEVIYG
jgi:hypothetical protein